MDGRIGHLHCHVLSTRPGAAPTAAIERVARERVAASLADALEPTLGGDPAVYVLRNLRADLALRAEDCVDDAVLARRWGDRLAVGVRRALAHGDDADSELVRFADQAEFVARFAGDLAAGSAWDRWFYGAFGELRPLGTGGALRAVLLGHRDLLPAVLAWLERHGTLESVLDALDDATRCLLVHRHAEEDAVRPLLSAALRLLHALGRHDPRAVDGEPLLERYLATGPAAVSWRDRRSLAQGVLAAIRFLVAEGLVAHAPASPADPAPAASVAQGPFGSLDWLDADWLRERLGDVLDVAPTDARSVAGRARHGLTPAQLRVVAQLEEVLAGGHVALDLHAVDSPANALRLVAALTARGTDGFDADVAAGVIDRVLHAAARLCSGPAGSELAAAVTAGGREAARAALLRRGADPAVAPALTELAARVVVLAAVTRPPHASAPAGDDALATPCAGALLLVRAALDLRLPALCAASGYPPEGGFPALLLAIAVRWGGLSASALDRIDPVLALLAGGQAPPSPRALDAACDVTSAVGRAFERALLAALARHGVVAGRTLVVHRLAVHGKRLLVAGPEDEAAWPLGRVSTGEADDDAVLDEWSEAWEAATGTRPRLRPATSSDAVRAALAAVAAQDRECLGSAGLALDLAALALLRAWARWLRGFDAASAPYLLDRLVRRPGRVMRSGGELTVWLEPGPLDVVLEMAGYLDELDATGILGWRLCFEVAKA